MTLIFDRFLQFVKVHVHALSGTQETHTKILCDLGHVTLTYDLDDDDPTGVKLTTF